MHFFFIFLFFFFFFLVLSPVAQLRALLEGSRNANESKRAAADADAIRSVPHVHGAAREAVDVRLQCVSACEIYRPGRVARFSYARYFVNVLYACLRALHAQWPSI